MVALRALGMRPYAVTAVPAGVVEPCPELLTGPYTIYPYTLTLTHTLYVH